MVAFSNEIYRAYSVSGEISPLSTHGLYFEIFRRTINKSTRYVSGENRFILYPLFCFMPFVKKTKTQSAFRDDYLREYST